MNSAINKHNDNTTNHINSQTTQNKAETTSKMKSDEIPVQCLSESNRHETQNGRDENCSTSGDDGSERYSSSSSSIDSPPPSPVPRKTKQNKLDQKKSRKGKNRKEKPQEEKWDSMNGDQIRQSARELLQSSPERSASEKKTGSTDKKYQSYHDAPAMSSMHRSSQFQNYANDSFPNSSSYASNQHERDQCDTSDNLSIYHIASMALDCMAHCLTEGYRAASTYYGGDDPSQHPSMSNIGSNHHNYQQVVRSYYNDNYSGNMDGNDNVGGDVCSGKDNAVGEMRREIALEPKGEYTSVPLPSTYQGGTR